MVWAVKYDSPQCAQDHMGMPSTISKDLPLPKLLVTRRSCTPEWPHEAHTPLDEIGRDDAENAREADLDDRFGIAVIERASSNDDFCFVGFTDFLALNDVARPAKTGVPLWISGSMVISWVFMADSAHGLSAQYTAPPIHRRLMSELCGADRRPHQ